MLASWPRLPVPPLAGDWGYRPITAYAGIVVREGDPRRHAPADLPWLAGGVIIDTPLGTTDTHRDRSATGLHHRHSAGSTGARR